MPLCERSAVRALPAYAVSKTVPEVCTAYGLTDACYLASNENPFGCSPKVTAALQTMTDLHRYPDSDGRALKQAISKRIRCAKAQVFLGNGSNEVLECAAKAFIEPGERVLVSAHSFAMYPIFAQLAGAELFIVPMRDWQIDLSAMLAAINEQTRLIYLATINNPTGSALAYADLQAFLTQVPGDVLVVVDEAYIEFATAAQTLVPLVQQHSNLLIARTFSKAYGLAGFRLGYGIAHQTLIGGLEKVRQPFNINSLAQTAAIAALADQAFVEQTIVHTLQQRQRLERVIQASGFQVLPSEANFICFRVGAEAGGLYEFMLSAGVIIRPLAAYSMAQWLRVSIGTEAENTAFINVLEQWNAKLQ